MTHKVNEAQHSWTEVRVGREVGRALVQERKKKRRKEAVSGIASQVEDG